MRLLQVIKHNTVAEESPYHTKKLNSSNIINGSFKVINLKQDIQTLEKIAKDCATLKKNTANESKRDDILWNEITTGYSNPITHKLNL